MTAITIDDEPKGRKVLATLLAQHCPQFTEVYEADNLLSGVELIKQHNPQLVFLDIEMPQHSGLELLDFIDPDQYEFQVVFCTAYSEYAIQAFEMNAVDYLLKPLRADKLKEACKKFSVVHSKQRINERLQELRRSLDGTNFTKIGLPHSGGIKFVELDSIIAMKADGMYTEFTTTDGNVVVSKPLKHFYQLLEKNAIFYRPHRSHIINIQHMQEYVKKDGGYIVMAGGLSVPMSRDRRDEFLTLVASL